MEKKGELLNQLAIISDLIEKLNTETVSNIITLELDEKAFIDAFEKIQKKYGKKSETPKDSFTISIGAVDIIFNKSNTQIVNVKLQEGELPPGLEINDAGVIRGYPLPPTTVISNLPTIITYAFTLKLVSGLGGSGSTFTVSLSQTTNNISMTGTSNWHSDW